MAPKVKYTREEIIQGALQAARRCGIQAVTARDVAAELNVSTRPIFGYFNSMQELREAVTETATAYYTEYTHKGLQDPYPFLGYGMRIIHFAQEERQLFRSLFMTTPTAEGKTLRETIFRLSEIVLKSVMQMYRMSEEEASYFYRSMILVGYGMACLVVTDCISYSDEEIKKVFMEYNFALCKAIKEIPGYMEGDYDKEALKEALYKHPAVVSRNQEGEKEQ